MTPAEYIQLKAFCRQDGALLALLWTASFVCYVIGLTQPSMGVVALLLALATPFFVSYRLGKFRDECLDGVLSFKRGWAFVIFTFFYASLLFALVQLVYFTYMDHGQFVAQLREMFAMPENAQMMKGMGMADSLNETLRMMAEMRPVDLVLNILFSNVVIGLIAGLPIAAVTKREVRSTTKKS